MAEESYRLGLALIIVLRKTLITSISRANGPANDKMNFMPGVLQLRVPLYGVRDALGRKPYIPQHRVGIQIKPGVVGYFLSWGNYLTSNIGSDA